MANDIRVLGLAGSLRKASYNLALLRAAAARAPKGMIVEIFDLSSVPLYNADTEAAGFPGPVTEMKTAIAGADALLIATPEYNHGVPGVLKNALDWASRPPSSSPLLKKPIGVIGASPGRVGTARAQTQIRQTFEFTDSPCMGQPELLVSYAHQRFDADGRLTDDRVALRLDTFLQALFAWTLRLRSEHAPIRATDWPHLPAADRHAGEPYAG